MSKEEFKVNEAEKQFELHASGHTAFLEYHLEGEKIFMTHTEAPKELRGTGAASKLVQAALQYSRDNGLTVVPSCSYVADYINKNPEWNDILSDGYQM